jgi:hypothetical protein
MHIKDRVTHTYSGRLFKTDKALFAVLFLFFAFSVFSNLIRLQTTPFFIWDMYSQKISALTYYDLYEIRYNDNKLFKLLHTWNEPEKTMLNAPLKLYLNMRANHSVDPFETYLKTHWVQKHPAFTHRIDALCNKPDALDRFPDWYFRYLTAQVHEPVRQVYVIDKKLRFLENGDLEMISTDTVLNIRK